jgi:uncharacterized protein
LPPESCEYRSDCSNLLTVEWNGDIYPCDFFVERDYRMGNVMEGTLEHMVQGPAFRRFVERAEEVPELCGDCTWLWACHGGCYRQRGKLGLAGQDRPFMCEANKRVFEHVFGTLDELKAKPVRPQLHGFLKDLEQRFRGPAQPAPRRPAADRPVPRQRGRAPGRNDPCPCGSGKKFKQCCMRRAGAGRR